MAISPQQRIQLGVEVLGWGLLAQLELGDMAVGDGGLVAELPLGERGADAELIGGGPREKHAMTDHEVPQPLDGEPERGTEVEANTNAAAEVLRRHTKTPRQCPRGESVEPPQPAPVEHRATIGRKSRRLGPMAGSRGKWAPSTHSGGVSN